VVALGRITCSLSSERMPRSFQHQTRVRDRVLNDGSWTRSCHSRRLWRTAGSAQLDVKDRFGSTPVTRSRSGLSGF
jgi:hypothetical protein